ncbi:hypothetical protein [Bradyrhizobium murdochi]|uniref:hypothetical protein n=1 Tax=Bradyrhizobium murdochi TaxID=1038859 RepID=UPI0012EB8C58|nr:hypothetical protein [Bradyrhizobium murdochi]
MDENSVSAVSYRYGVTFDAPVYFGNTVTAKLVVREKDEERNTCIFTATRSPTRTALSWRQAALPEGLLMQTADCGGLVKFCHTETNADRQPACQAALDQPGKQALVRAAGRSQSP